MCDWLANQAQRDNSTPMVIQTVLDNLSGSQDETKRHECRRGPSREELGDERVEEEIEGRGMRIIEMHYIYV